MNGVFLMALKTAELIHVFKKDSKLDHSNCPIDYRPICLLSKIEKILEKLMQKRFLITILSIVCSLDSDNNILHLMP